MSMGAFHFSLRKDCFSRCFSGSSARSVGRWLLFGKSSGSSFGGSVVRPVACSFGRSFVVCSFLPSAVWSACFASSNAVCFSKAAF